MKWVNNIGKVVLKALAFLPCFFTVANYFTVLTEKQRTEMAGIFFFGSQCGLFSAGSLFPNS